jgi:hypothetical protein
MHASSLPAIGLCAAFAFPIAAKAQDHPARATTANVEITFAGLPEQAAAVKLVVGKPALPRGGHLQGVQWRHDAGGQRDLVYLSHDSETIAYLIVAEFAPDLKSAGRVVHVHRFPSDDQSPPLRHAGGFQIAGDVLAIGLEDNQLKARSQVQFWNVATPENPIRYEHLTIRRLGKPKEQTAGAVALIERRRDCWLAVANWDSRAIDFYVSNGKPLADSECRFAHQVRWLADAADSHDWHPDQRFGAYQSIHFVADQDDHLFLFGLDTEPSGADVVELFAVSTDAPPASMLRKLARRPVRLVAGSHFRFAGGVGTSNGQITILASPRNLAEEIQLNVVR